MDHDPPEPKAGASWAGLPTESRHPASRDLDILEPETIVALLLDEDRRGLEMARDRKAEITDAAHRFARTLAAGGDVVFAGAGTSGRLGVLEAAECPPTFGTEPERIRAVIAGGKEAVFAAREGAEDREDDGRTAVEDVGAGDLVIGLSASSVTPFVLGALAAGRERGAGTLLITCARREGLEGVADRVVALGTGAEILTGSTRLKAGSATKAVLNAITTTAMVELGKTYGNLMVDLRPGSAKLRDRALRIVVAAAEVDLDEARRLYEGAERNVKAAIVMGRRGVGAAEARRLLQEAGGRVRQALG